MAKRFEDLDFKDTAKYLDQAEYLINRGYSDDHDIFEVAKKIYTSRHPDHDTEQEKP